MTDRPRATRHWRDAALALVALSAFLIPALINGSPIIYPDTVGYFHAGESALAIGASSLGESAPGAAVEPSILAARTDNGVSTSRSIFYGVPLALLYSLGGTWLVALAQSALSIASAWLLLRHLKIGNSWTRGAIVIASGACGAAAFAITLMPDFLAGLALLGAALLLGRWGALTTSERIYWGFLVLAGALVHKAILATLILLLGLALLALLAARRPVRPALATGLWIGFAILGHIGVDIGIERVSGRPPIEPPFLLARMVGDGTMPAYLDRVCERQNLLLCRYRDRMPMTENDFLWGLDPAKSVFATASLEDRQRIAAEANLLVRGALMSDPWHQLVRTLANIGRQLFVTGIEEYGVMPYDVAKDDSGMRSTLMEYTRDSGIAEQTMPLRAFSVAIQLPYLLAIGALAFLFGRGRRTIEPSFWWFAAFLLAGIFLNAAVCGGVAGVFDRYQGRVAWLVPLTAICAYALLRRAERTTEQAGTNPTTTAPAAP
jgi:hypothetical protein